MSLRRGLLDQQHHDSSSALALARPHVDSVPFAVARHDPARRPAEVVAHLDALEVLKLVAPVGLLFGLTWSLFFRVLGILWHPPAEVPSEEDSKARDEPPRRRRG